MSEERANNVRPYQDRKRSFEESYGFFYDHPQQNDKPKFISVFSCLVMLPWVGNITTECNCNSHRNSHGMSPRPWVGRGRNRIAGTEPRNQTEINCAKVPVGASRPRKCLSGHPDRESACRGVPTICHPHPKYILPKCKKTLGLI